MLQSKRNSLRTIFNDIFSKQFNTDKISVETFNTMLLTKIPFAVNKYIEYLEEQIKQN
jgi:hypothetical protein